MAPLLIAILLLIAPVTSAAPRRIALLVGIDDYSASRLTPIREPAPLRDWPNLSGAVNDSTAMRDLLVLLRGFDARDINLLDDQNATRAAILDALHRLATTAGKDDIVFVYFAGHGSQVRNTLSDEPDKLDESIVPADSRRGAADIRDKELRRIFNAILDRGAHLTVMIDACHSGSGARGLLTLAQPRGIAPDLRDVRDGGAFGPRPENRGALVISAAHDEEEAREIRDDGKTMHGAFTWAWMRAMRDAAPGEPAIDTFTRAQARLRAEMPFQNPVIAGNSPQRRAPFLGRGESAPRGGFAIERVRNGVATISGGWAHGITVGSKLRVDAAPPPLVVTALLGLGRCEAQVPAAARVRSGMLVALAGWAVPPPRPLRIAIPRFDGDVVNFARRAAALAADLVTDPTTRTPDSVLRRGGTRWELLDAAGHVTTFASDADALRAVAGVRGSLFLQLPATSALASQIASPAFENVDRVEDADYVLAGRLVRHRLEYAWIRPNAGRNAAVPAAGAAASRRRRERDALDPAGEDAGIPSAAAASALPPRTTWITATPDAAVALRDRALRLQKIASWLFLEPPPASGWPYHLALRSDRDRHLVGDGGRVFGGETYTLELRAASASAIRRHVYIFAIDSWGESTLLFPVSGSVENHLPIGRESVIPLDAKFEIAPPYGVDTYVLLSSEEPLPNPWILQWDGVRAARVVAPAGWSIECITIQSVRRKRSAAGGRTQWP